ncbi:bacteriophage abortive infection AbiH family protein [Sabulilitoribacter multivorans]|uniref:Bacteriophage abortive infection AbiH family protein n=1 Tax=Flaviramulus multivorans TaxID=1304750 RepID=A0ABS9ILX2_9FLAO|nr:AbiH family protein [Flaviramulus multivorans]MCF7561606.1 bacteriophage abortive infection AbiH family protein [Flaviramulus multivorans]
MKQVIIIGNGFDIAHGLPTSFKNFSKFLLEEILISDLEQFVLKTGTSDYYTDGIKGIFKQHLFPVGYNNNYSLEGVLLNLSKENFKLSLINNKMIFLEHLKNKFLSKLYREEEEFWFDVESTYFDMLSNIRKSKDKNSHKDQVLRLNEELIQIKNLLQEYLATLNVNFDSPVSNFIKSLFKSFQNEGNTNDIVVIDFNYTQTIRSFDVIGYEHYPIHGTLDSEIIFGWGNDKDGDYVEIKNLRDDNFLTNFKTHHYLKNNYYQLIYNSLIRVKEKFNIHVLGHSLGLTDKSLLKEIFESHNCERIYLYLRSDKYKSELEDNKQIEVENEFTKLTMAISRIIDDEMARVKVVNMKYSNYFPKRVK